MTSNLKLFHISAEPDFPWRFLKGQIQFMKKKGIEVHVVSSPHPYLNKIASRDGIQVHGVQISRKISPFSDFLSVCALLLLFLRERPDIIHAHTPKGGLVALIAAWIARVPVRIYHIHGLPLLSATGVKRCLLKFCDKLTCFLSTQVFCVSQSNMKIAIGSGLCPSYKIKVIQNGTIDGIDAEGEFNPLAFNEKLRTNVRREFGIDPDSVVIGYVGRILEEKGISELHEAWKEVKRCTENVVLFLVGPLDDRSPVREDIISSFRSDKSVYLTECWFESMPSCYSAIDILVLPSYREGFGLVSLEASSMKVPVVATNIPGCTDAIKNGVTGILVPPRDAKTLAEALIMYLKNPDLRALHGTAGRRRVLEKFSQEPIWKETYNSYIRFIGRRRGGKG